MSERFVFSGKCSNRKMSELSKKMEGKRNVRDEWKISKNFLRGKRRMDFLSRDALVNESFFNKRALVAKIANVINTGLTCLK